MTSRQRHKVMTMEGLIMPTKIRKRGCSSSSSSSSRIHNYRLNKRAILVGKSRAGLGIGLGGSRSSTPVPTWRTTPMKSAIDSPKYSQSGKSTQPVSARRLAATLWEMNEMPSPKMSESNLELMKQQQKKNGSKMVFKREKMQFGWGLHSGSGSGPLPPHLSDPSNSPTVSEKMDRSGTGGRLRTPSISQRLRSAEENAAVFDSISNASFMEVETRSRAPTSSGSVSGGRNRLKDISNALTTSKELLKIINRIWAHADQPSSSASVISALHAELERARLQVNQLSQEQRSDKNEINYLMKCFAEEKASWKNKEHQAIEAAIGSIAGELEIERKLRRRLESLNKKLGKELAEMKSSFMKAVQELESERRAREITEQVCDELARNVDEDRVEVENLKSESVKVHEEAEKEREMLALADKLLEERAQVKLSEAKHQVEEKNSAISKLRKQLEVFLGTKRDKDDRKATHLSKSNISSDQKEQEDDDAIDDTKEDSVESDLHSIELNMNHNNKGCKLAYTSAIGHESRKLPIDEIKARNSISGQVSRRSTSLQRSVSDGVEWDIQGASHRISADGLDRERVHEIEKEAQRRSYLEETQQRYNKPVKGLKDHILLSSRLSSTRDSHSPTQQRDQSWPLRDPLGTVHERHSAILAMGSKSRTTDVRGEGQSTRRSKW
ncbi:hypothetical protein Salat_1021400 [Sesamum alatum]|uniref:Uncharacterized protein n=1 Tax=Sesamum alatum TaxID=300844 RepID=A0AAE1YM94_9LAMI|nr:hypothetical protein Salat_1021400 [Sesamum alatum]